MSDFLLIERDDAIVTLTMNQPDKRNPLTGNSAVPEFLAAIAAIQQDRSVRAVIITGSGSAFSAGGDIREMARQSSGMVDGLAIREDYRQGIQRLPLALYDLEVPTIAAVNGPAMGAGLDLACMCDLRVASTKARFAESFVKLGIIPGDGGAWFLPRLIGPSRAAELALTGDPIDTETALAWGLVSRVVDPDTLMACAKDLARRIAANSPSTVRMTKRLLHESLHSRLDSLLQMSAAYQALAHQTADHREAVSAFLEKRPAVF